MASIRDPHALTLGSVSATDVLSVDYSDAAGPIQGRADDDVFDTIAEFGGASIQGSIMLRDRAQAESLAHQGPATLSFSTKGTGGGADQVYTILLCSTGGVQGNIVRDGISGFAVPFVAASADGTTSPLSAT